MLRAGAGLLATAVVLALPAGATVRAVQERAAFALLEDGRLVRIGLTTGHAACCAG